EAADADDDAIDAADREFGDRFPEWRGADVRLADLGGDRHASGKDAVLDAFHQLGEIRVGSDVAQPAAELLLRGDPVPGLVLPVQHDVAVLAILQADRYGRAIEDRLQAGLALAQRPLGVDASGDVAQGADDLERLSRGVPNQPETHLHPNPMAVAMPDAIRHAGPLTTGGHAPIDIEEA